VARAATRRSECADRARARSVSSIRRRLLAPSPKSNGSLMHLTGVDSSFPNRSTPWRRCRHKNLTDRLKPSDGCCQTCVGWTDTSASPLRIFQATATTANMVPRHTGSGQYEIYNLGNNSILAAAWLGQVGTDWAFVTLGGFSGSDTSDMMLRNSTTGAFQVYDVGNNNITGSAALGTVGLNWQVA